MEASLCLRFQIEYLQLGPIDRVSLYFLTNKYSWWYENYFKNPDLNEIRK